ASVDERLGREPRPERDAARQRGTRRDPEAERIALERRSRVAQVAAQLGERRRAGEGARECEKPPAIDDLPVQGRQSPAWIRHHSPFDALQPPRWAVYITLGASGSASSCASAP